LVIVLFWVFWVLAIELHPPVTDCPAWPTDHFDSNVLAAFALDVCKQAFTFLRKFPSCARTFENARRRHPVLAHNVLAKTSGANEHLNLLEKYLLKISQKKKESIDLQSDNI
jgi:hypothetical protein